eukprot:TRINITY_DN3565_c0_g2_i1.p1 TRINITY_DN3565_c0_g2~~TRINITY_DN3565_c0_g2_i1.p1  ORF type:complete len:334 (-),score=81.45 TRINITY_DN3565_c0_g2_i1:103-1104(-)
MAADSDDARSRWQDQLQKTNAIYKQLKAQISNLEKTLEEADRIEARKDLRDDDGLLRTKDDLRIKCEHLKASSCVYKSVRKFMKTTDVSMEDLYFDFDDENEEKKKKADEVYNGMTRVLHIFEKRMTAVSHAPTSWFKTYYLEVTQWFKANPKKAAGIPVALATAAGASLAAFNHNYGYCLIYYFYTSGGAAASSWGLAASAGLGAAGGLVIGALLVLAVNFFKKCYKYHYAQDETSKAMQEIDAMVKKLKAMSQNEINEHLIQLTELCDKAIGNNIPQLRADQMCQICFKHGLDVKQPVKAPRCTHDHFMCKDSCWIPHLTEFGDKCPLCFV